MPALDSSVLGICKACEKPFTYTFLGRSKWYCPECSVAKARAASLAHQSRVKRGPTELHGLSENGLKSIARMTQVQASARLCVIETLEKIKETGDPNAEVKPLTQQAVQQLERVALLKIRKALLPYWLEYKRGLDGDSRETTRHRSTYSAWEGCFMRPGAAAIHSEIMRSS